MVYIIGSVALSTRCKKERINQIIVDRLLVWLVLYQCWLR